MSSRNVYLSAEQRQSALVLFESLELADRRLKDGAQSISQVQEEMLALLASRTGVVPDYAVICDPQTLQELSEPQPKMVALVAARLGTTRLIDNREITIQ